MGVVASDEGLWRAVHSCVMNVLEMSGGASPLSGESDPFLDIAPAEITGLTVLLEEIKKRPNARAKLEVPKDGEGAEWFIPQREVAQIPLTLAANALRKFGPEPTDAQLVDDYLPYERYLLADPNHMSAEIYVPIIGIEPVEIESTDASYSIEQMTEAHRRIFIANDARSRIADYDVTTLNSPSALLRLRASSVRVEGFGLYHFSHLTDEAEEQVNRLFESLTIVSPHAPTWAECAIAPIDWCAYRNDQVWRVNIARNYTDKIDQVRDIIWGDQGYKIDGPTTELAFKLTDRLGLSHPSVRVSAKRYRRALTRGDDDDRIVDLCISLEAILGTGSGETVHRLSMRTAAILCQLWRSPAEEIYKATRNLYNYRSKIVHGDSVGIMEGMVTLGKHQVHLSRFGAAALSAILEHVILDTDFNPNDLDARYIFAAFDSGLAGGEN